jgi:hypothetical protein
VGGLLVSKQKIMKVFKYNFDNMVDPKVPE